MILIWWTNQADCEAIDENGSEGCLDANFPRYMRDQYSSRHGRNGRGRLWVADQFGEVAVDPWPETPLGNVLDEKPRLGQSYAGIVIEEADSALLYDMPGVITTINLQRYPSA